VSHSFEGSPTPAVVVNANNISALTTIRALGRQNIPVIAVFGRGALDQYASVVRSSRFISKAHIFDESNYETNMINCLLAVGASCPTKAVLFPASDKDMIIVSDNRQQLEQYYHLLMPSHGLLCTLLSKDLFYPFAEARGIQVPRTFPVSCWDDIVTARRGISYPCIVKPGWRNEAWQRQYGNDKVIVVKNAVELKCTLRSLYNRFERLVVQEIVPGSERDILCTFTYLTEESEPLGIFTCRKIRQFPANFGNSSLVQQVNEPEVGELTVQISKQLGLVGYVSIEFKKDERNGTYKVIEITPCRFNRQTGLADAAGLCLPYVWYCHVLHRPVEPVVHSGRRAWVSEVNELRAFWHYWRKGEYTLAGWFSGYTDLVQYELFSKDDVLPFMMLLPSALFYWVGSLRFGPSRTFGKSMLRAATTLFPTSERSKN